MKIAICDDDSLQLEYICALVQKWSNLAGENTDVLLYSNAEELLFSYTPGCFDALLLDIQMTGENGVSLAKRIRSFNDDAAIIFITAVSDYVFDGYDVGAVQYLLKPVNENKLFECLNTLHKRVPDKMKIIFENDEGSTVCTIDDILYLEAFSHKTKVVLIDRSLFINESIGSIENRIGGGFYKCHRSYIVNLRHINSIKKYDAVMDNGLTVPISRRIFNDFSSAFIQYHRR